MSSHVTRIACDLADNVTLKFNIITRPIERYAHPSSGTLSGDHPWQSNIARIPGRHDLPFSAFSDTPLGRTCRIDHALNFISTRESR